MFEPTIVVCPECGQLIFGQWTTAGLVHICPTCHWKDPPTNVTYSINSKETKNVCP